MLALFELRMLRGLGVLPSWEALPGLPAAVIPTLEGWLLSEWSPLPRDLQRRTLTSLEGLIQGVSGRLLRSRAVLDELVGR